MSEEAASAARKGTPETARLQRELDISVAEARDLREKVSRVEEESERTRHRLENRIRELEAERSRSDEQVCYQSDLSVEVIICLPCIFPIISQQIKSLVARDTESVRTREDLIKANQKITQLESDNQFIKRQQDDDLDRLEREVRRYHSEVSDLTLENRRLKSLYGSAVTSLPIPVVPDVEYGKPTIPQSRIHRAPPEPPPTNQRRYDAPPSTEPAAPQKRSEGSKSLSSIVPAPAVPAGIKKKKERIMSPHRPYEEDNLVLGEPDRYINL